MTTKTIPQLTETVALADTYVFPVDTGVETFKTKHGTLRRRFQADAVIGTADGCTHATLAAALADAALTTNVTVYVTLSATIATSIAMAKAGWEVEFAPGVTYTAGGATVCFTVSAARCSFKRARLTGFTTGFLFQAGGLHGRVADCYFTSSMTDNVDDSAVVALGGCALYGNIDEP